MMKRYLLPLVVVVSASALSSCGMYQSMVKSSFPYTTTLTIPASAKAGNEISCISMADNFDENFSKGDKIALVRVISARLMSVQPTDYNLGKIEAVKIFLSKQDGSGEILVARRDNINDNAGNNITLDTDNTKFLDQLVREQGIRVRMAYRLRKTDTTAVNVHVILNLAAYPADRSRDQLE